MRRQDLIDYANAKNLNWEEHFPSSDIKTNDCSYLYIVGIELKPWVWYWWSTLIINVEDADSYHLSFRERYNMHNGVSQKGWFRGYQAEEKILSIKQ